MKRLSVLLFFLFGTLFGFAQKKPLDHTVYDGWQHIGEKMISNDARWIVYTIDPQEGDNELVIRSSDGRYSKSVPRGYNALITEDSRYLVFKIKPCYKDIREAKLKKKKPDDMPKDSLGIIELWKEEIWKKERVAGYKTPQRSEGWIAYQLEKTPEPAGKPKIPDLKNAGNRMNDSLRHVIDSLETVIATFPVKKKKNKDETEEGENVPGSITDEADADVEPSPAEPAFDLVVRDLANGRETVFTKVLEYQFSRSGNRLVMELAPVQGDSARERQLIYYDLNKMKPLTISRGGNDFRNFALTEDGTRLAFVAEREARPKDPVKYYKLWYYQENMDSAILLAEKNSVGMQLGMTVSEFGTVGFSKSGNRIFFGTAPVPVAKDTSIIEMDMPKLDIWHYNDDYLQTVQLQPARFKAAQQENYLAMYSLDNQSVRQIGSREIPQIIMTNEGDGERFVGVTDFGKRVEGQWLGTTRKDIYAMDVITGNAKLVKENLSGQVYPSATGKYILWYDRKEKNYFVWDGLGVKNITQKIKSPLYQEEWDLPDDPSNYGVVKWEQDDHAVFIYDRYGIWKTDPAGLKQSVYLYGDRAGKTRYRYLQTDPDEKYISPGQVMVLSTFNESSKYAGLWRSVYDTTTNPKILLPLHTDDGHLLSAVSKARNAEHYIFHMESYQESPDLYHWYLTDEGPDGNKLSSINPQQQNYLWGTAELFSWKAYDGKMATGIVYKPENFDPRKKYPTIVYFYEKLSDGLYDYKEPAPIRSAVNIPYFVSNGYLVFTPDIRYKTGYPGQGAYDYIVSGARALVKKGWADSTNIAIQGHSWGGYQAAQLATMTKLFKVVWAGAPVANMTSAYGGIRWESGISRQFQYEKTQSRIGATLWERQDLYLKNSPLFHLDKVTAPMVIMANDADGAVPWYQGIELFTALRRLGKKVWMFNYNGQGHGLTQRQDMKDYHIRMQQFFDYMLKGAHPSKWITEGVPAVKKGKEWGLEME